MSSEELFHQEGITTRYQHFVLGYFFPCNKFGCKVIDCRDYVKCDHVRDINRGSYKASNNYHVKSEKRSSQGFVDRNYNSFSPLLDYNTRNVIISITMGTKHMIV